MGTSASRPTASVAEITKNLTSIEQYISENHDKITKNDKERINEFLTTFSKQLRQNGSKRNTFHAQRQIDDIRTRLKNIPTCKDNYTLPRVNDLITLFENPDFRRRSSSRSSRKFKPKDILRELSQIEVDIKTKNFTPAQVDDMQKRLIEYAQQIPHKNRTAEMNKVMRTISDLQTQLVNMKTEQRASTKEEDLDSITVETHSFIASYPSNFKQIIDRMRSDVGMLQRFIENFSGESLQTNDLSRATQAIEEVERDLKRAKKRLLEESFKWTKTKSQQFLHTLDEIEEEINRCDFVQVLKDKGKDEAKSVLGGFQARVASIEEVGKDVAERKNEVNSLLANVSTFMNNCLVGTAFDKMEIDHNKFKQQIINFSDSEKSADYKNFMGYLLKLKKYATQLQSPDEVLQERKAKMIEELNRSMKIMKHKAQKFDQTKEGKATAEKQQVILMQLITSYAKQLEEIAKDVEKEKGLTNLQKTEKKIILEKIRDDFLNLNISLENQTFAKKRNSYLERIDVLLELLKKEDRQEVVMRPKSTNDVAPRLNSLKKKVNRFTGTYQNILYKTIERDLKQILQEMEESGSSDDGLRQDIEKQLKILEQKSSKETNGQDQVDSTRKSFTLVRNALSTIKIPAEPSQEELKKVKEQMDYCYNVLDNLMSKDPNVQKEKIELYKEIKGVSNTLSDKIQQKAEEFSSGSQKKYPTEKHLKELAEIRRNLNEIQEKIKSTSAKEDNSIKEGIEKCYTMLSEVKAPGLVEERSALFKDIGYWSEVYNKKVLAIELMNNIEAELSAVRPRIEQFNTGKTEEEEYARLDESLISMTLKLDRCKLDKTSAEFARRNQLMKLIQELADVLDMRQTGEIDEIEKNVNVLLIRLDGMPDNFDRGNADELRAEVERLSELVDGLVEPKEGKQKLVDKLKVCRNKLDQLYTANITK